jgi:hypothetical protein
MEVGVTLEERVNLLERQNRGLKRVLFLIALLPVLALCVAGVAPRKQVPDEIVAHSIRVVSDDGKNEASLGATSDGFVILSFRDLLGVQRFALLMTPSGKPSISFFDGKRSRLQLGVVDRGDAEEYSFVLSDNTGGSVWRPPSENLLSESKAK